MHCPKLLMLRRRPKGLNSRSLGFVVQHPLNFNLGPVHNKCEYILTPIILITINQAHEHIEAMGSSNSSSRPRSRKPSIHIQSPVHQQDPQAYKNLSPPPYPGESFSSSDNLFPPDSQAGVQRSRSLGRPPPGPTSDASSVRRRSVGPIPERRSSNGPPTVSNPPISFPAPYIPSGSGGGVPSFLISPAPNATRPSGTTSSSSRVDTSPTRRSTEEDLLEMLRNFDTIVIVDDSSSVSGSDSRASPKFSPLNRWQIIVRTQRAKIAGIRPAMHSLDSSISQSSMTPMVSIYIF